MNNPTLICKELSFFENKYYDKLDETFEAAVPTLMQFIKDNVDTYWNPEIRYKDRDKDISTTRQSVCFELINKKKELIDSFLTNKINNS